MQVREDGKILEVSEPEPGSIHDLTVKRNSTPIPRNALALADSGYQGYQNEHENIWLPYKNTKKKKLTKEQKEHNKALASLRILVENTICKLKVFQILYQQYRNRRNGYAITMKIVAGIVNLKMGF